MRTLIKRDEAQRLRCLAELSLTAVTVTCIIEDLREQRGDMTWLTGEDAEALACIVNDFFAAVETIERRGTI